MSGPPGWHASPAQPVPPSAARAGSLHKHTGAAGGEPCQGRIWPCRAKQLSVVPPALFERSSRTSPVPAPRLLPASFPQPNVSHPPGPLEMPCSPAGPQAGPSACSCPLSSPAERLMELLGLAGLVGSGCIHPAQAIMGKLPGNFSSAPTARSSCWVR